MQNFKNGIVPVADNKASSLLKMAERELADLYETSELETIGFWLLEHFADISRSDFLKNSETLVNQSPIIHFCNAVEKLKEGVPIQYVVGEVDFYGLKLNVNNSVLVPRPETEELVDLIVKQNSGREGLRILDLGTGSGCIALSLASWFKDSLITAIDISETALTTAGKNAEKNSITNVEFLRMDILEENFLEVGEFDIIVSNPPYIAESERSSMAKNVLDHEPETALFVPDNNALVFYERIVELLQKHLKKKGLVYVEINERLGSETVNLFTNEIFESAELINDMFGKNRFIKAVRL